MTRQRSRLRLFSATLCGVAITSSLTGCFNGNGAADAEAGMGLPTLSDAEATAVLATATDVTDEHEGTLTIADNGCFIWSEPDSSADGAWIVWPDGNQQDADAVVLDDGTRATAGTTLLAHGGVVTLDVLPDGDDGSSYFGSFGAFCGADERGVLVLTVVATRYNR